MTDDTPPPTGLLTSTERETLHHLHKISDGGVDDLENVIAICPNCHCEVHYGQEGDDLNETLIAKAAERNKRFV